MDGMPKNAEALALCPQSELAALSSALEPWAYRLSRTTQAELERGQARLDETSPPTPLLLSSSAFDSAEALLDFADRISRFAPTLIVAKDIAEETVPLARHSRAAADYAR
jgi:hypothetical protein